MSAEMMINEILEWAEDHPDFDTSFVESLKDQLSQRDLTDSQIRALENIIEGFHI